MLTILAIAAQVCAVAALLWRKSWRTLPVLFWAEMIQALLMLAFYVLPGRYLYALWHDDHKISVGIWLIVFGAYIERRWMLRTIATLSVANAFLILALYSPLDGDSTLCANGMLYWAHIAGSMMFDVLVAVAVYTGNGNTQKEPQMNDKLPKHPHEPISPHPLKPNEDGIIPSPPPPPPTDSTL